jgi:hypothetical protein
VGIGLDPVEESMAKRTTNGDLAKKRVFSLREVARYTGLSTAKCMKALPSIVLSGRGKIENRARFVRRQVDARMGDLGLVRGKR